MKNLSKSEKFLIALLLIIVVAYVYFQYLIMPVSNDISAVKSKIEEYNNELLQIRIFTASNKKLSEDINTLKEKQVEYQDFLPNTDKAAEVIRDFKKLGDSNKLIINSLALGQASEYTTQDNAQKASENNNSEANNNQANSTQESIVKSMMLPVTITVSGDYKGILEFIKSIEEGTRIIEVTSVNISSEGNDKENSIKASIIANILFIQDGTKVKNQYDFNNGIYGKEDLFK
jgi:type IV pilus assembly protein PilO